MYRWTVTPAFLSVFLCFNVMAGGSAQTSQTSKLSNFDYTGVRLLDSHWKDQQQDVIEYYLSIPTDNYLIGFRKRAGKPAPGTELGGWYSEDRFNSFGQILSGLARFHAATGDTKVKSKVDEMVAGFVECIEPDGYHFYSRNCNAPHYEFDKFLGGLIDANLYCDNAIARQAISPITDWAIQNLDPSPKYPQLPGQANVEGYTLTENLYRAYILTGDQKYRDFGKHWEYWGWWDKFITKSPVDLYIQPDGNKMPHYHAYSHVNSLGGLATGYTVTQDDKYLDRLINSYDVTRKNQAYVTGGYGPMERYTHRTALEKAIDYSNRHFETQCGSWAVFKLSKYLQTFTADGRYADWAEQMIYNGIGGSINMDAGGKVQYFSNYSSRGAKKININPWSCCTGTRPQAVADYVDQIYYKDGSDLYVSLFLPSQVSWQVDSSTATLKMETAFPAEERVRMVIDHGPSTSFTINVRRPSWLAGDAQFTVNGESIATSISASNWYPISRSWSSGDVLEFNLPMKPEWKPFNPENPFPGAVTYGPVALAWLSSSDNPSEGRTPEQLINALQRSTGQFSWSVNDSPSTIVKPWYMVGPEEKYHLYLDPKTGQYVDLGNGWRTNEIHMISDLPKSEATFSFEGTGVRFHYSRFDDAGIAKVLVDGKEVALIDQYAPGRNIDAHRDITELPDGKHTLAVICSGEKNPASKARVINIKRFEVLNGS